MDLQTFFRIVLRYWWLILLSTLATVGAASYVVSTQAKQYQAITQIRLAPNPELDLGQQIGALTLLRDTTAINTVARIGEGLQMQNTVAQKLAVKPEDIAGAKLTTSVIPSTSLIDITAQSTDPRFAAAITNQVADEMVGLNSGNAVFVEITSRSPVPVEPFSPQPVQTITLAVIFGIVLGLVFSVLGYLLSTNWARTKSEQADQDASFVPTRDSSAQTQQLYTR